MIESLSTHTTQIDQAAFNAGSGIRRPSSLEAGFYVARHFL